LAYLWYQEPGSAIFQKKIMKVKKIVLLIKDREIEKNFS